MKRAVATLLLLAMLCALPGTTLAARQDEITLPAVPQTQEDHEAPPQPVPTELHTVINELSAIWQNQRSAPQYPADVGGIAVSRSKDKLVVLLVNNTAARQAEIRRMVSYPNVLQFYSCKYSYAELSAVFDEVARIIPTDGGVSTVGIGYSSNDGRPFPGFGPSGYEMRVCIGAATKADYERLSKEMAERFGDKVHINKQVGVLVPTDDAAAASAAREGTATGSVNVRSGPGTGYKKLGRLKRGDTVEVLDVTKKWARIVWDDGEAYVYAKYLRMAY